jgi:shikimate kinase
MKRISKKDSAKGDSDRARIVFLTGLSGSGKSTIGVELAGLMKRQFVDVDERIVEQEGQSIREIFTSCGEQRFREIEAEVIRETIATCTRARPDGYIVALGGGALLSAENVDCVTDAGLLIYLEVTCAAAAERLQGNVDRPLALAADGTLLSIEELSVRLTALLEARLEGFSRADHVVVTTSASVTGICESICSYIT